MKTDAQCLEGTLTWGLDGARKPLVGASEMSGEGREMVSGTAFWDKLAPYKSKLYNYIHKSLNFSTEAEDVFQETILHAFQYIRSYKEDQDFGSWLFGIAHNEIKKHYKRIPKNAPPSELEGLSSADMSSTRQLVGEVYRFAEQLNPRQREVFFLFYDNGFSMAEISSITGLREGNIKFILNQARNALKTTLGVSHDR